MREDILAVIVADILFILVLVGAAVSVLVLVSQLVLFPTVGLSMGFAEGYSMCPANSFALSYLPLGNSKCAYAPGDVLITLRMWPPEVNHIACAVINPYGIVCHRVNKVSDDKACFIGDNPRAKVTWCFGREAYIGEVIGKLPRAFGIPGMAYTAMRVTIENFLTSVNSGQYPTGKVS